MDNTKAHQKLVDDLLFAFGSRPDVRVWTRQVGFDSFRKIKFGIPGESDIDGIYKDGRRISIECKTGTGKLSKQQEVFRDMIIKFNGIYVLARTVDQSLTDFQSQL